MQYQVILILFNIFIALAAYFFLRGRRHLFRIIIMPVVYAYFLAAFLPYLLAYVPANWVIAFYTVAILLGFLAKGIDSRVQPDIEAQGLDATVWSEADPDYIETRSEREALLNTVKFSKVQPDNDQLFSRILIESATSPVKPGPSESFEKAQPVLEPTLLSSISQTGSTAASNLSSDLVSEKHGDNDHSPLPLEGEKPIQKSTQVQDAASEAQSEEEEPDMAEPAAVTYATVSYLSDYKEEKAALASAAGDASVNPGEPSREEKPQSVRTTPVINQFPLQPSAEIELNKKAVEEIAQKFANKLINGHQEGPPSKVQETSLTTEKDSDSTYGQELDKQETSITGESELPLLAASLSDTGQEQHTFIKETQTLNQEPHVVVKFDVSPPKIAAAIYEAPAERHLELVEASLDRHPDENEPQIFEGVEPSLTNQQIPAGDAGEMVSNKEFINDQQEATEDDLMQLDLALVIDRAFQAKFSSDYQKAIRIFEVALNRTPSPKLAQMIAEDIEVMRSKLA